MSDTRERMAPPLGISRRELLTQAALAAGAYGYLAAPALARRHRRHHKHHAHRKRHRPGGRRGADITAQVAVLGAGPGGLTAAHELAERGFRVTVIEPKALGGKARSIPVANTGAGGRADLPGEHGFRFFPGFYKNIPDTMRRIPFAGNPNGVFDNLVNATQELLIFENGEAWAPPSFDSSGFQEGITTLVTLIGIAASVPANEIEYFVRKLEVFFTSSDARRVGEWEHVPWWDFTNAQNFSPEYQRAFGTGLTKDLVAAKGKLASTRTVGLMAEAFVYAALGEQFPQVHQESGYGAADRLLNAPTDEAWIDPWVAHLQTLDVRFLLGYAATKLHLDGGHVVAAELTGAKNGSMTIAADWFVAAMPVERARILFDASVRAAAPELALLDKLEYDYMNGIQFFLNRGPSEQVHGHVAFLESPWALTSIEQGLFWNRDIARTYGDGRVKDIVSVDISDFFTPGILYRKRAVDCTPAQIAAETWAQMKQALNTNGKTVLSDDMIVTWFLDPAVTFPSGGPAVSAEPLLINTAGSLSSRPESHTSIPNLFLAADYVKVNIDLATMEGANEAGRQAANVLLARAGSNATPATLGTLWQPAELDSVRRADEQRYANGQPNALDAVPSAVPA